MTCPALDGHGRAAGANPMPNQQRQHSQPEPIKAQHGAPRRGSPPPPVVQDTSKRAPPSRVPRSDPFPRERTFFAGSVAKYGHAKGYMNTNISSAELAKQLNVSQRHARRMILAGDSRIDGPDREWFARCSRKREAELVIQQALAISERLTALECVSRGEAYDSGPELDRLQKVISSIRRQVIALEGIGHDLYPKD
jgi:hypothetical protein